MLRIHSGGLLKSIALGTAILLCAAPGCGFNAQRPEVRGSGGQVRGMPRPVLDLHDIWDRELDRMMGTGAIEADVSALLGGQPAQCEQAEDGEPTLGLDLAAGSSDVPTVASVRRGGPAQHAGLRRGMELRQVEGLAVVTVAEATDRIRSAARVGEALAITTGARVHSLVPVRRDVLLGDRKCYWTPTHGSIGSSESSYQVACRFAKGVLTICVSAHGDAGHGH